MTARVRMVGAGDGGGRVMRRLWAIYAIGLLILPPAAAQIEYAEGPQQPYGLERISTSEYRSDERLYTFFLRARNLRDCVRLFKGIRNELGLTDLLPVSDERIEKSTTTPPVGPLILMEWNDLYREEPGELGVTEAEGREFLDRLYSGEGYVPSPWPVRPQLMCSRHPMGGWIMGQLRMSTKWVDVVTKEAAREQ